MYAFTTVCFVVFSISIDHLKFPLDCGETEGEKNEHRCVLERETKHADLFKCVKKRRQSSIIIMCMDTLAALFVGQMMLSIKAFRSFSHRYASSTSHLFAPGHATC